MMDLKACYDYLEGDYGSVLSRLRQEDRVKRFLYLFLKDDSYEKLTRALQTGDRDEAFRAAHTLKGVCQNLSFTRLYTSSAALTEALRGGAKGDISGLTEQVRTDYMRTVEAIRRLRQDEGAGPEPQI